MLEIIGCPECAAPAEVVTRFVLDSTDGPVEHATVACAGRHRFTMPVERLPGSASVEVSRVAGASRSLLHEYTDPRRAGPRRPRDPHPGRRPAG